MAHMPVLWYVLCWNERHHQGGRFRSHGKTRQRRWELMAIDGWMGIAERAQTDKLVDQIVHSSSQELHARCHRQSHQRPQRCLRQGP